VFLHAEPDRVIAIGLRPGPGLVADGALLEVGMEVACRGDQRDPADSEHLAWAVWALLVDPGPDLTGPRALIGGGLQLRNVTAPASPAFAGIDGATGAMRPIHTCTYLLTLGDAPQSLLDIAERTTGTTS
jgi:hypothetical protein